MKLAQALVVGLAGVGLLFLLVAVHELFHVVVSGDPVSLCYDFGSRTIGHVDSYGEASVLEEVSAYVVTLVVCVSGMLLVVKYAGGLR